MRPMAPVRTPPALLPCCLWANCPNATDLTEAKVQKELAQEEDSRLAAGGTSLHTTSPGSFLTLAMELEELQ